MARRILPIEPGISAQSFTVQLDNRPFQFRFIFNGRAELWLFSIFDDAGTLLLADVPVFTKQELIGLYQHDLRLPQGVLFAVNETEQDTKPTFENLGSDVLILYEEVNGTAA